jgi:uncharacterized protein
MAKDFLGSGWPFPVVPDATGALSYVSEDASVEQSLRVLLLTARGERVMRPDFGTEAPRMVFLAGSVKNLRLLETTIRNAIRDWEPRVEVLDLRAELDRDPERPGDPSANDETRAIVSLSYRVVQSNSKLNLVFPFYLGQVETP